MPIGARSTACSRTRTSLRRRFPAEEYAKKRQYFASNAIGGYPFVGTPDRVADELESISKAGVRGIALSFVNYLDELPYFCARCCRAWCGSVHAVGCRPAIFPDTIAGFAANPVQDCDDGSPSPSSENHDQPAMMTSLACGAREDDSRDNAHGSVKNVQFARIRSPVRGSAAAGRIEKSKTDVDDRHRHCRDAAPCRPLLTVAADARGGGGGGGAVGEAAASVVTEEALAAATSAALAVVLGASAAVISVGASAVVSGALVATSGDCRPFPARGTGGRNSGLVHLGGSRIGAGGL